MKRIKKLALQTETIRQLDSNELGAAVGGAYKTQYCQGGGGGNPVITEPEGRDAAYQYDVQYAQQYRGY